MWENSSINRTLMLFFLISVVLVEFGYRLYLGTSRTCLEYRVGEPNSEECCPRGAKSSNKKLEETKSSKWIVILENLFPREVLSRISLLEVKFHRIWGLEDSIPQIDDLEGQKISYNQIRGERSSRNFYSRMVSRGIKYR